MTSFGTWLKPTLLGPLLTLWSLTTFAVVAGALGVLSGGRIDSWLMGMMWATFFGSTLGVLTVGVDVALLRAKLRRLPTGATAWIASLTAPLLVFFIWSLPFVPPPASVLGVVAFFLLPMVAATVLLRMTFGARPSAG